MPKSANQKLKLLYLMRIMLEQADDKHGLTLSDIRKLLLGYGVTAERKSLYDDMEALRVFGLDVERQGHRYYVANRTFQLPELKLLVDAVQSSRFITRRKSEELIKKVESLASIHEARLLQRQVYVANRIKTMNESIYYNIDKLHDAISAGEQIRFLYFDWSLDEMGSSRLKKSYRRAREYYQISPWALTWNEENYYLIAFDREAGIVKHYRVDKMEDIQLTGEKRDGQEHFERFDMAMYTQKMFGMFGGHEEMVELAFANHLAGVVADRFGRDVTFVRMDPKHFRVHVMVEVSPQFLSWVFGFGNEVRILSPENVVQQFTGQASDILAQYKEIFGNKIEK